MQALLKTEFKDLKLFRRGKVRDVYDLGDKLLIVATDRISAFDVILPNGIPDKGKILSQMAAYWFEFTGRDLRNHVIETDSVRYPSHLSKYAGQLAGRSMLVSKTVPVEIECIVRGYISGSGWKEYQRDGAVSGIRLPSGLKESEQLPEPIFTPSTKSNEGHDENISYQETESSIGKDLAYLLREKSIRLYSLAAKKALESGIIIADTKFEFGLLDGEAILIDEILTPDSSRFWPADDYEAGRPQASFDKQYVRDYLCTLDWNKTPPGPPLPEEVIRNTRKKYLEAFEKITGRKFE
jgi:phosphoribosylaminoimidazole-succinocarboxamide synthase